VSIEAWLAGRTTRGALGPQAERVAHVLVRAPQFASYASAREVAERAGVNVSTVVRTAQQLGFDGWPQLREELRARYLASVSSGELSASPAGVVSRDPGQTGRTQPLPVPGRSGRVRPQRAADPGPGRAWRGLERVKERQIQLGEAVPGIRDTVHKWRRRLLAERLDGLVDEPRPRRPPTIGVDQVEAVVVTTLEQLPKNATHWWPDHLVRTRSSGGSATWPTR
jgi:transposase